jgi:flagellar basal-body rod protein FlgB
MDALFGVHAASLQMRSLRARVLATNLANADTPGFLARDVDFKDALQTATDSRVRMWSTHPQHIHFNPMQPTPDELAYRVATQPALDGNTVDTQVEQAEFAKNSLQYEASLRFLNGRISGLLLALKGE